MCLAPILVPNKGKLTSFSSSVCRPDKMPWRYTDQVSNYIYVPCGTCPECIGLKQAYFIQRSELESMDHYIFMITLTYQSQYLSYLDIFSGTMTEPLRFYYADKRDIQCMFKRIRKYGYIDRPFKYFAVSEFGSKRHRPHWHICLFIEKRPGDTEYTPLRYEHELAPVFLKHWVRNFGSTRNPLYKPLCIYKTDRRGRKNYDFHYVVPKLTSSGTDDVSFYVTKYMMKADKWLRKRQQMLRLNLSPEEYEKVWKVVKPRMLVSKFFGVTSSSPAYVRSCIDKAKLNNSPYPFFINPNCGHTSPLGPYLRHKYLTEVDKIHFYYSSQENYLDPDKVNPHKQEQSYIRYNKVVDQITQNQLDFIEVDDFY